MNKSAVQQRKPLSSVRKHPSELSKETTQLMSLGANHKWDFRILGQAPMPKKPTRLGDWLLVPALEDTSRIPLRTLKRIQAIFAAGIRPHGFVLVHEAPMSLSDSTTASTVKPMTDNNILSSQPLLTSFESIFRTALPIMSSLASIAVACLTLIGVSIIPATIMVGVLLLDPILVVVTEDGYWIEIDRWWNEETA